MKQTTPFDEMDRLFEQMRRSLLEGRPPVGAARSNVSLESDDDGYVVHADVPGFEPDEIDLRYDDGVLTIDATHETEDEDGTRSRHLHDRVRIPGEVVVEEIAAECNNGVLEVRLPAEDDAETGYWIDVD